MIPAFNASMVLPPYVGDNPGVRALMSPYPASMLELVERFATSPERVGILNGLLSYREALLTAGLSDGHQWLDGSFVEDVESSRKRAPRDIDLVTFARSPFVDLAERRQWFLANLGLFDRNQTSLNFKCDAFFVDLRSKPELLVNDTRYWFGLFAHQRETALWKGMLEVPMLSDDALAKVRLDAITFHHEEAQNAQEA